MKLVVFKRNKNDLDFQIGALIDDTRISNLTHLTGFNELSGSQINQTFDLESDFLSSAIRELENGNLEKLEKDSIQICPPVPAPEKFICIGLNYFDHAKEAGIEIPKTPLIFSKFPSSVIGPNHPIQLPIGSNEVDYEAEFAIVIGKTASRIASADAYEYVLGYTNCNDVSARDFQFADGQWQRGKSCDTFAPIGEFIATKDEISNPHNLRISFKLNGQTLQDSNTKELIFKIPEIIEFISSSITLRPGDVIASGTPPGVGFARKPPIYLQDGDIAEVSIEGLGVLSNPVKSS